MKSRTKVLINQPRYQSLSQKKFQNHSRQKKDVSSFAHPQREISLQKTGMKPETIIRHARLATGSLSHENVMQLQRTFGNQAVGNLMQSIKAGTIQLKRYPTQTMSGFQEISGVEKFDPNDEPKSQLAFVVLEEGGPIWTATGEKGRHPAIYETAKNMTGYEETMDRPSVYYAGAIHPIQYERYGWVNDSGHFIPEAEYAPQAGLPMKRFVDWETYFAEGFNSIKKGLIPKTEALVIPRGTLITIPLIDNIESQSSEDEQEQIRHLSAGRILAGTLATIFTLGIVWCSPGFREYMRGTLENDESDELGLSELTTTSNYGDYRNLLGSDFDEEIGQISKDEKW
jgi:hypothetical protein